MKKLILAAFIFVSCHLQPQSFIPIWPQEKMPNFNGLQVKDSIANDRIWKVNTPGMYAFLVPKEENKGTAILICPGGGYERLSYLYNGFNLAKWYNTLGINAFVLKYRLPHQQNLVTRELAPLQDAQRAMKVIRSHANEWGLLPGKIGVMGTSAGGHLAGMLGNYVKDESVIHDALDTVSVRPDFMVLLSPVVTMGQYTHAGSKKNLLGIDASQQKIQAFSNELQVTDATPPAFIVHALNDSTVNVQNSLQLYTALLQHHVNASIHIFPQGGHSIKVDDNPGSADLWLELLEQWLKEMQFLLPKNKSN